MNCHHTHPWKNRINREIGKGKKPNTVNSDFVSHFICSLDVDSCIDCYCGYNEPCYRNKFHAAIDAQFEMVNMLTCSHHLCYEASTQIEAAISKFGPSITLKQLIEEVIINTKELSDMNEVHKDYHYTNLHYSYKVFFVDPDTPRYSTELLEE